MNVLETVKEFKNGNVQVLAELVCSRCNGNGNFEHLKHVDGGTCYQCNGRGVEVKKVTIETEQNKQARERKAAAKKATKHVPVEADHSDTFKNNVKVMQPYMDRVKRIVARGTTKEKNLIYALKSFIQVHPIRDFEKKSELAALIADGDISLHNDFLDALNAR